VKKFRMIIGADILPTPSNNSLFEKGDTALLVGNELKEYLNSADYRVFNLEGALTDEESPITKDGPVLRAPVDSAIGIKKLGADLLVLANNHILDHGNKGVISTIETLRRNGINYIGCGINGNIEKNICIQTECGTFGIYNCCEHEYSVNNLNESYSAHAYDPLKAFNDVSELSQKCDYTIVLYHGGKEKYRYPSPELQKRFRKFADSGANLVVAQHTHCIGCQEHYGNSTLVYGQGNFIFDRADNEYYNNGLLIDISFAEDGSVEVGYKVVEKNGNKVRLAEKELSNRILEEFFHRSKEIENPRFIEDRFNEYCSDNLAEYLITFHGKNLVSKILIRLNKNLYKKYIYKCFYNKKNMIYLYNFLRCEAHYEVVLNGIGLTLEE